jgi:hypothetical protein
MDRRQGETCAAEYAKLRARRRDCSLPALDADSALRCSTTATHSLPYFPTCNRPGDKYIVIRYNHET